MRLQSHWDAHPWAPDESRLHWYLLPDRTAAEPARRLQTRLRRPGLDPVPAPWLHATVLSLLPVPPAEVADLVDAVRDAVAGLAAPVGEGRAVVVPEAVLWALEPEAPFAAVFTAVAAAVGPWRRTRTDKPFRPHVTVAYAGAEFDGAELEGQLDAARLEGADRLPPARFDALHLLDVRRQDRTYRWTPVARIPLEGP